jgi:hypothetical protein
MGQDEILFVALLLVAVAVEGGFVGVRQEDGVTKREKDHLEGVELEVSLDIWTGHPPLLLVPVLLLVLSLMMTNVNVF